MIIENRGGFKDHAKIISLYIGLALIDYIITSYFISALMKVDDTEKKESYAVHTVILFAFEVNSIRLIYVCRVNSSLC